MSNTILLYLFFVDLPRHVAPFAASCALHPQLLHRRLRDNQLWHFCQQGGFGVLQLGGVCLQEFVKQGQELRCPADDGNATILSALPWCTVNDMSADGV